MTFIQNDVIPSRRQQVFLVKPHSRVGGNEDTRGIANFINQCILYNEGENAENINLQPTITYYYYSNNYGMKITSPNKF